MPLAGLGVLGAIGIGGSIGSGIAGAYASSKAASTQANAANHAADLEAQSQKDALDYTKQKDAQNRQDLMPWLTGGSQGINMLAQLLGTQGQGLLTPFSEQFQAPTGADAAADPGYQFRLSEGMKALDRGAAARGGVLSGGTAKAEQRYGQDYASNEYGNVYNRRMGEYQNRFNIFNANQTNTYNRLAGLAGAGQTAATTLGNLGNQSAANISNTLLSGSAQIGNDYMNAANARASGYVGGANALSGLFGNLSNYGLLSQLLGKH